MSAIASKLDEINAPEHVVDALNAKLCDGTITPEEIIKLFYLCVSKRKKEMAHLCVVTGMFLCTNSSLTKHQSLEVALAAFHYWRIESFFSKGHYRVNTSAERKNLIQDVGIILGALHELQDPELGDIVGLNYAMALESYGDFVKSLSVLSDMISREASNGVDLSYVIFRAAVILLHLNREAQACDYLDFIQEDAPSGSGYGRAHILALLSIIYESRGKKYKHMLAAVDTTFQFIREEELPFLNAYAEKKRAESPNARGDFITFKTCKIWETFALQALSKGDYVYAAEMFKQVLRRKPANEALVYLTLSEVYYLLAEKELALKAAEASYELESQSVETRNMLLLIAPEKWQDALRLAAKVREAKREEVDDDNGRALTETDLKSHLVQRKYVTDAEEDYGRSKLPAIGGNWLTKLTPYNKDYQVELPSPTQSHAPSDAGARSRAQSAISDYNGSTVESIADSTVSSPRESEKLPSIGSSSAKDKYLSTSSRRSSIRPVRPSVSMDEETRRMVQAMLSGEFQSNISGGANPSGNRRNAVVSVAGPTYDMIMKQLALQTPAPVLELDNALPEGDEDDSEDD